MEKEKILFKIRDYNNELEKIIEKKSFSESTKNLLLSMLYKIETAYGDYTMVKRQTLQKNDYLETILLTILQSCSIINFVKPGMEDAKILEDAKKNCLINPDKNEIFAYQNETSLLQAILEMGEREKKYSVEEDILQKPVSDFFEQGKLQEMLEVIKDFNGWSWNISKDEPNGQEAKICYLNLLYLIGIDSVIKMENEQKCIEFLFKKLKEYYGEELAKEFFTCFLQNVVRIYAKKDEEYLQLLKEEEKKWKTQLAEIQDKANYLEKLTKEKIQINSRIGQIDLILNNNQLLKKNYTETNKKLPMEKKHFSVSTYAETLEEERKGLMEKRGEINQLFEPEKFIAKRNWIAQRDDFFKGMELEDFSKENCLEKLQQLFWKLYQVKIQKTEDKKELINQIFELRYYTIQTKERKLFESQKEQQKSVQQELLKKAIQMKVCNKMTKDEKQNEKILSVIFDSKIVNLENMELAITEDEKETKIEIYDEKVLETVVTMEKIGWNEKSKKRRKIFD